MCFSNLFGNDNDSTSLLFFFLLLVVLFMNCDAFGDDNDSLLFFFLLLVVLVVPFLPVFVCNWFNKIRPCVSGPLEASRCVGL